MIFTGTKPEKLTDEDLLTIGDTESKAFMISFYNELLRITHGGRNLIRVDAVFRQNAEDAKGEQH